MCIRGPGVGGDKLMSVLSESMALPRRLAGVAALLLMLSGCFDVDQQLSVDQTRFSYNAVLRVDAKLAAMAAQRGKGDFCDEFIPLSAKIPEQVVLSKTQSIEGGNQVCRVTLQGPTLAFEAISSKQGKGIGDMAIERIDERTLKLTNVLRMDERLAQDPKMLDMLLAGRLMKWSITAPRILDSNGTISADGKRVDWAVPVSALFAEPQTFEAVFEYDPPRIAQVLRSALRLLDSVLERIGLARK